VNQCPLAFLTNSVEQYNQPAGELMEALKKPLVIRSVDKEWTILSYYYDSNVGRMVLDIQPKGRQ
jgi:hypothetical protein